MKLPIDIRDIMNSGTKLREDRERRVRLAVFVDVEAPKALVEAVREALIPQTGGAMLHVEACGPGEVLLVDPATDAVIALTGPGNSLERSLAAARDKFVPTVVVALDELVQDGGGGRGYGSIVAAGSVLLVLTPKSELVVFQPGRFDLRRRRDRQGRF